MRHQDDYDYAPRSQRRTGLGTVILLSVFSSGIVSVLVVYALHRFGPTHATALLERAVATAPARADGGSEARLRVPELIGLQVQAAENLLSAQKLDLVIRQHLPDANLPAGAVLAQRPRSDSMIEGGGVVEVMVSTGPPTTESPNGAADTRLEDLVNR